jgi:hypothetical protein
MRTDPSNNRQRLGVAIGREGSWIGPRVSTGWSKWWAHCDSTRINIAPTIRYKKIEDLREAGVCRVTQHHP